VASGTDLQNFIYCCKDGNGFTLIVTSHYPIEECLSGEAEREAMKGRFQEVEITVDNSDVLMRCRLNRGILAEPAGAFWENRRLALRNEQRGGMAGPFRMTFVVAPPWR
jgi:hypothetical protein